MARLKVYVKKIGMTLDYIGPRDDQRSKLLSSIIRFSAFNSNRYLQVLVPLCQARITKWRKLKVATHYQTNRHLRVAKRSHRGYGRSWV